MTIEQMEIEVTPSAQTFLADLVASHEVQPTACYLFVERGGSPSAETFLSYHYPEDHKAGDLCLSFEGFELYLDQASFQFLKQTKVDYNQDKDRLVLHSPHAKLSLSSQSKPLMTQSKVTGQQIPSGLPISIEAGKEVRLVHQNPRSVTVLSEGNWIRLEAEVATSALGIEFLDLQHAPEPLTQEYLYGLLSQCYDPEIPVNVVDLGLIYDLSIKGLQEEAPKDEQSQGKPLYEIEVIMTLTAPGCAMADSILADIQMTLESVPSVKQATVHMVFDPPWNQQMMSERAKLQLGM